MLKTAYVTVLTLGLTACSADQFGDDWPDLLPVSEFLTQDEETNPSSGISQARIDALRARATALKNASF